MNISSHYSDITHWFLQTILTLLQQKKIVIIGLPGGHSLDGWYASVLADREIWRNIDTTRLRWCVVDERCVDAESADRNDRHVWKTFLEPIGIFIPEQCLCFGASPVEALEYSDTISELDVAIFWLWPDGHIASLFPGHPALTAQVEGYIHIHDAPKMPPERITLTPLSIQKIPHTALFAVWPTKKEALENFQSPQKTVSECPAKLLSPDIIFQQ